MSRIDDLIATYCSNGVEHKVLGVVAEVYTGEQFNKRDMEDVGECPVINGGILPSGYSDKYNETANTITVSQGGASAGYVNFIKVKFWLGAHCYAIKLKSNILDNKFVFYCIKQQENKLMQSQEGAGIPSLNRKKLNSILIPVPPLPVQQEIVRILDSFSELEKELETREKQYEYYRNQLLSFGEGGDYANNVKWAKLGNVAEIYDGTHTTPRYTESGVKFVSVENISDLYATTKYISTDDYNKYKTKPRINDVFMTRIGSIGSCAIVDKNEDLAYYVSLALIRPNTEKILSKYVKYIIESKIGKKELAKRTLMMAVPIKINLSEIGKIQIPLPPLSEQERIVAILDKFDALVNDISVGLPAEIDARRKQYEYYRDKLLTFPKAD